MADTSPVFRAIITAVDKASAVMDRIGGRAKKLGRELEHLSNPWGKAAGEISIFTRASNMAHIAAARLRTIAEPFEHAREPVHQLTEGVHKLGEKIHGIGESLTEMLPMLGLLGGAGSLAGIFEIAHKATESFVQLSRGAEKIGITVEQMRQLSYAAQMTDTPVENLDTAMFMLNRRIGDAAAGKNKDVAALFKHLGIASRDAHGHLVTVAEVMPQLQEAFRKTTDPAMRARMAMALFERQGRDMLPLLMAGADEMKDWSKQADRMNYVFSPADGENLEAFRISWINLKTAVGGFMDELGSRLAPVLTPIVEKIADWAATNRDWIATDITDAVRQLGDWIMKLDFDKVVKETAGWVHWIGNLVDKTIGAKWAIILLIGVVEMRWLAAAASFVVSLTTIATGAVRAAWAIGTPMVNAIGAATMAVAKFDAAFSKSALGRTAMIAFSMYDKVAAPDFGVNQEMLDKADPARAAAAGYTRNDAGKWEHNGAELPGAPTTPPELIPPRYNPFRSGFWGGVYNAFPGGDNAGDTPRDTTSGPLFDQVRRSIAGSRDGKVDVNVMFDNVPAGVTIKTSGSGVTSEPQSDVGYAFPGMALAQ